MKQRFDFDTNLRKKIREQAEKPVAGLLRFLCLAANRRSERHFDKLRMNRIAASIAWRRGEGKTVATKDGIRIKER